MFNTRPWTARGRDTSRREHLTHYAHALQTKQRKKETNEQTHTDTHTQTHTMAPVTFWQAPGTWIHYMARRKPALFWSVVVGSLGPVSMVWTRRCGHTDTTPPETWMTHKILTAGTARCPAHQTPIGRWTTKPNTSYLPEYVHPIGTDAKEPHGH